MEIIKSNISFFEEILRKNKLYEESSDVIVPDSLPDIHTIVGAVASVSIKDETPQNDRLLTSGVVHVKVIYLADGSTTPHIVPLDINFAHIEDCKGILADSKVFSNADVIKLESRMINPRKISVIAQLKLNLVGYENKSIEISSGTDNSDDDLYVLKQNIDARLPISVQKMSFTVMDDIEVNLEDEPKELIGYNCKIQNIDTKVMPGKLIIKADLITNCIYIDQNNKMDSIKVTLPFSQIFDIEHNTSIDETTAKFNVKMLDIEIRDALTLSIGASIDAFIIGSGSFTVENICDAYHTQNEFEITSVNHQLKSSECKTKVIDDIEKTINLELPPSNILDVGTRVENVYVSEDNSVIEIDIMTTAIYQTPDGSPAIIVQPDSISIPISKVADKLKVNDVLVTPSSYVGEGNSIKTRFKIELDLCDYKDMPISTISNININAEETIKSQDNVTLVLKYVDSSSSLWDIAKTYNTSVANILSANKLSEEETYIEGKMLLIPIKQ